MQPTQPLPVQTNPLGVGSVPAVAPPTATPTPTAPAVAPTPAPVATPAFDTAGTMGAIADYYKIPRDTASIVGQGQAQAGVAESQQKADQYQNQIKIQHAQDALDPNKYTFTHNRDGSLTILNSAGDKVDIGTYASLTGANPAEVLQKQGATDEKSQQFIQAYSNLQTYIQAKIAAQNGDQTAQKTVDEFNQTNKGLQNLELGQLQSAFMSQYGSYFGQPQGDQDALKKAGANPTLTSSNPSTSTSSIDALYAQLGITPSGQ